MTGFARLILRLLGVLLLAGCATLPAFGPSAAAIDEAAADVVAQDQDVLPYRIVEISPATLPQTEDVAQRFPAVLRQQTLRTTDARIDVGDRLDIRIWEIAEDGLFATAGRRETSLPLVVAESGTISAPYAGTVTARGLTAPDLRALLLDRYRGQAIEPEIAVTIAETPSRSVTILGAVNAPGRSMIPSRGIRLLDLIAQAGGTPHAPWETMVTVRRDATTATLAMSDILRSAANNIVILPQDVVSLAHVPRRFAVYGAVNQPGNVEVPLETATLAYLLAETGGLNDGVAAATSVFVFRPVAAGGSDDAVRAIAYRFDFSVPDAFFLAGMFTLAPTDIVYVTAAPVVDFQRFMSLVLSPVTGTVAAVRN